MFCNFVNTYNIFNFKLFWMCWGIRFKASKKCEHKCNTKYPYAMHYSSYQGGNLNPKQSLRQNMTSHWTSYDSWLPASTRQSTYGKYSTERGSQRVYSYDISKPWLSGVQLWPASLFLGTLQSIQVSFHFPIIVWHWTMHNYCCINCQAPTDKGRF